MATKILLLTQWFDPEPAFKGLVFARALVEKGYDVEVLTGFPNYPGGKIYPNYKIKPLQRELLDGVKVTRVPLYPSHDQSAIKRILNYISFAISALVYGLFFAKRFDIVYAYHPPLTVGIVAVLLRFFRKASVVYDIQDMWPDTLRATGMITSKRVLNIVSKVCNWVYRHVDHIVVLSPGFKELLIERKVPENKISIIYNWCDEAALEIKPQPENFPLDFPRKDKFRILFAGNMGKAQGLGSVLDAAKICEEQASNLCFIFVGGGVEVPTLKQKVLGLNLKNVYFYPAVPVSEIAGFLNKADALLVHLRKDPLFEITIPSKIQAYMAIGKPILMSVNGDAADIVEKAKCGVVTEPENALDIALAAQSLCDFSDNELEQMSQNSRQYYQNHLSLQVGVSSFSELFQKLKGIKQ